MLEKEKTLEKYSRIFPVLASKIQSPFLRKCRLKKLEAKKPLSGLKISDPVLTCKNQKKISVGYGICDDFP